MNGQNTIIILISGKAQAGKSTTCDYLINQYFSKFHKYFDMVVKEYSFADPLKQFLINVFGCSYEQMYGTDDQKNSLTRIQWKNLPLAPHKISVVWQECRKTEYLYAINGEEFLTARELMQIFGTQVCRAMWGDCWANATKNKILKEKPDIAIIPDTRFPNEIDFFISMNPITIRLERNPIHRDHYSELALDNYDWGKLPKNHLLLLDNSQLNQEQKEIAITKFMNGIKI